MFRDYSKLGQKEILPANCKYYLNTKDETSICLVLPNGASVLLKSVDSFTRHTECPRYTPKSKWFFSPDLLSIKGKTTEEINEVGGMFPEVRKSFQLINKYSGKQD